MKKLTLLLALLAGLFFARPINAQSPSGPRIYFTSVNPTGNACAATTPMIVYFTGTTQTAFLCQGGVETAVGGGGGSCSTLAGDVTGACGSNTVVKVNGAAIPTSALFVGTNSSNQFGALTQSQALTALGLTANMNIRDVGFNFSNGGAALSGTTTVCDVVEVAGTITKWYVVGDVSGSATIGVKSVATGSYTGIAGFSGYTDVTGGGTAPSLSSAVYAASSTLTNWVTAITADTIYCLQLTSPATVTNLSVHLRYTAN